VKNWNNNEIENFKHSMKVILRAVNPDFPQTDGAGVDEKILDYLIEFRHDMNTTELVLTTPEAIKMFQEWYHQKYTRAGQSEQEFLQVTVTRGIGNEQVAITLGSGFAIHSGAGRSVGYDRLFSAINIEFDRYIRDRLPQQNGDPDIGMFKGNTTEKWVDVTRLDVEVKSGKRYFKVKCGQWQQHGVNYWPETMKAHGRVPANIPLEGIDLAGYKALVQMEGENPKRIVQLIKNE